jgi:hypothetical protein
MPRHSDFQKIFDAFMWRYCKDHKECKEGKDYYYAWLNKLGLDDTKPYQNPQEKFSWTKPYLKFLKEDEKAKYFKCEALFPLSSMNNNVYTKDELLQAARSLVGKTVDLNHTDEKLPEVTIYDAQYEDNCVECLLRVEKESKALKLIEKEEILQVSIEADCLRGTEQTPEGNVCHGLVFTGLALLTKDTLPGVPLTRILPVEKLVESFTVTSVTNLNEPNSQNQTPKPKQMANVCGTCNWIVDNPEANAVVDKCPECGAPAYYIPMIFAEQIRQKKAEQNLAPPPLQPPQTPPPQQTPPPLADPAGQEAEWTAAYINELPNSSFAVIEPAYLDGKTEDKRCRHLPYKDKDGTVDLPHLRNALARMNQIEPVTDSISAADLRAKAEKVLVAAAKAAKIGDYELYPYLKIQDLEAEMHALQQVVFQGFEALKKPKEEPKPAPKNEPCKCVLTKEGFWSRFHQLRSEGLNKTDAFRLVSIEVIEAATKKSQ